MNPAARTILVLAIAWSVTGLLFFPRWTVDDAFISYRYADNLVRHGELNWNPGSDPVEGYTGIALPLLLAAWIRIMGDPVLGGRMLGMIGYVLLCAGFHAWLGRLRISALAASAAFAGLATNPILFTHATSGLETCLFLAAVVGALWGFERVVQDGSSRSEIGLWLLLLAASLIRPEGAALAGITALAIFWMRGREGWSARAARFAAFFFLPGLAYFLWRWNYYGRLLPNTFYAKTFEGGLNLSSAVSLLEFAHTHLSIPLAGLAIGWLLFQIRKDRAADRRDLRQIPPVSLWIALVFALILCAGYLRSRLIMNYSHRFYAPMLPVGWAVAAFWMNILLERARGLSPRTVSAGFGGVTLLILALHGYLLPGERRQAAEYQATMTHEHTAIGKKLAAMPGVGSVACVIDAGAIPYYSGLKAYDFGRLNDEYLAGPNRTMAETADYFFRVNPDAAVFTTRNWRRVDYLPESGAITDDPRFAQYDLVARYRVPPGMPASTYYQFLYLRRDIRERLAMGVVDPGRPEPANGESASGP